MVQGQGYQTCQHNYVWTWASSVASLEPQFLPLESVDGDRDLSVSQTSGTEAHLMLVSPTLSFTS